MSKVAINMRADEELRNAIDRAALLLNKDRTSFILDTMRREAENVILDQRMISVEREVFDQLDQLVNQSVSENHKLKALLQSKSPWE